MSDLLTGQRVRLWDGSAEFGFLSSSPLYTRIHDTNQELNPVAFDAAAVGTEGGVASMAQRLDVGASLVTASGDWTPLQVDALGNLRVVISGGGNSSVQLDDAAFTPTTSSVTMMGAFADEAGTDSVDEGDGGAVRMTLDRKLLMVLTDPTVDTQRLGINAAGQAQVDLAAVSVTAVPVSATAAVNAETNPIFVQIVSGAVSGNEVHDFDQTTNTAAAATANHDYTVVGTTFFLKGLILSASSEARYELLVGPLASLVAKAVIFTTAANPSKHIPFDPPIEVPVASTGTVRVIKKNDDNQAQDLYSTIIGFDV